MFTPQFDRFIDPARAYPQIWRIIVGLLLSIAVYAIVIAAMLVCVWLVVGADRLLALSTDTLTEQTPLTTVIMLLSFIGMALGPMLAVRWVHKRPVRTLFGNRVTVLRDFTTSAVIVTLIYVVSISIWALGFDAVPNLDFTTWLKFLPLILVALAIQTCAEELVFRGYLQQQLAARFKSPIVWMILPSLMFGALHYDPANPLITVTFVIGSAFLFGMVAADLTRITGSLGAAWGFHFMNNLFGVAFISLDGPLSGYALFTTPYGASELSNYPWMILVDLATLILTWWIIRQTIRR